MFCWIRIAATAAMLAAALPGAAAGTDVPELRSRAERFWAAEVRKDFDTVYTMLSPGERDLRAQGDYVATRRDLGPFHYLSAKVGDIDSAGDVGWVRITVVYTTPKFPQARIDGEFWQVWRNQDGWFPVAVKDRERYPELPPSLRPVADEAALKERATGLWKAKAEQDWPTVYRYMPPYWRERVPLETFLKGKAGLVYVDPKVDWVEIGPDGPARASITFQFRPNDPAVSKMPLQTASLVEPWVKTDGTWYLDTSVLEQPPAAATNPQ